MADEKDKDISNLNARMRSEWNRRVEHDYRYWMSDGVSSDTEMWRTGERDFASLVEGLDLSNAPQHTALEIGCGVGRILKAASSRFARVFGVDISSSALSQAKQLLADRTNIVLLASETLPLSEIPNDTVDFVYSFAALSSMPSVTLAEYICEMQRVLKLGSRARLQLYVGKEQETVSEDTLAIRSYELSRLQQACASAGFEFECAKELQLPFNISNSEAGLVASIVSLQKSRAVEANAKQVYSILLSQAEQSAGTQWVGSQAEYMMALFRARELAGQDNYSEAKVALDFAEKSIEKIPVEFRELHAELYAKFRQSCDSIVKGKSGTPVVHDANGYNRLGVLFSPEVFQRNLEELRKRFPAVADQVLQTHLTDDISLTTSQTGEPAIVYQGIPLDQVQKPTRAAEVWVERSLASPRVSAAQNLLIGGFAGGYHLEALLKQTQAKIHVVEPQLQILKAALSVRNLTDLISKVGSLATNIERGFEAKLQAVEVLVHPQSGTVSQADFDQLRQRVISHRGLKDLRPSIAVVGPIYGGTLPISAYVYRALQELGQRVRYFDFSGFAGGYRLVGEMVKDHNRVSSLQNYYVEMLSQTVLEAVTEKPVDIVISLAQAPLTPRVLTELRKRGIITVMWFVEDCRRFLTWKEISKYYDYMFVIQKGEIIHQVEAAGAGRVHYLPTACDPGIHRPMDLTAEERTRFGSDLSFVGAGYNNRLQMFASLAGRDFKIWGTEWPGAMPFDRLVQEKGRRIDPTDYVKIFNASKVNLNLHSSMERDGVEPNGDFINPRTFELASAGAFQLVDTRTLLGELFVPGQDVVTFENGAEMEQLIDYYLAHPEERQKFAENARRRVLSEHTYRHRMEQMLGIIFADRYQELWDRSQSGPWQKTLSGAEDFPELQKRFQVAFERGDEPKLDALVADIQTGKGSLTETEQTLLFLHHVKKQIVYINELRQGKTA